ncbi:MAG: hypothetical protein AAB512_05520 [Patescibacteria group bacterium]
MSIKGPESLPTGLRRRNPDSKRPLQGQEMGPTGSQTLRSQAKPPTDTENRLKDLPPTGGFINTTTRDGVQTQIPSVGQYTLEGEKIPIDQIQTTRGTHKIQPKDAAPLAVPSGGPTPAEMDKANRQMWKITRETLRWAEKGKKKK